MYKELLAKGIMQFDNKLPFVMYRKPQKSEVKAILQKDAQLHYSKDYKESGFIFAPFNSKEKSILIKSDLILTEDFKVTSIIPERNSPETSTTQKDIHIHLVKKGISKIKNSPLKKVVLSRSQEVQCSENPFKIFENILCLYQNAFCYLWYHPKIGMWLGATPEILLESENKNIKTISLAGTQAFDGTENPQWETKELEEQQLVTDYISKALGPLVASLKIGKRESVRAGNLWHLRTKLTGRLRVEDLKELINAIHPTPAVCGLPLKDAKAFILENENYDREFYTGFLGELNLKIEKERSRNARNIENKAYKSIKRKSSLYVNLRCMQLQDSRVQIYIGGGITKDSNAEKEWIETLAKTETMLRVISTC